MNRWSSVLLIACPVPNLPTYFPVVVVPGQYIAVPYSVFQTKINSAARYAVNNTWCSVRLCRNNKSWVHKNSPGNSMTPENRAAYWRANLRLVTGCMLVWFICSYGFGVLFVEQLNAIRVGGFKLGFWFAQQGSIYVFVALIFFYAWRMNKMDRKYDVHED